MFIDCTNCQTHVDAEKGGELQYWASEGNRPGRFMLLRCPRCRSPLLIEQENTGDMPATFGILPPSFSTRSPICE
jgi:hypothetical protein